MVLLCDLSLFEKKFVLKVHNPVKKRNYQFFKAKINI